MLDTIPVCEAIFILHVVARARVDAHCQGVVYRDIESANVLLDKGTALVAAFGIAKAP